MNNLHSLFGYQSHFVLLRINAEFHRSYLKHYETCSKHACMKTNIPVCILSNFLFHQNHKLEISQLRTSERSKNTFKNF